MKIKWCGLVLLWSLSNLVAAAGTLEIREAYIREMPPGQSTTAAFMNLVNTGNRPIALVAATSDGAGQAEVHRHRNQNGMMQMEQVTRVEIPAHGQLLFAPGGYHLMLINLKRSFRAGDKINVTLLDEEGKFYTAAVPVVNMLGSAAPAR